MLTVCAPMRAATPPGLNGLGLEQLQDGLGAVGRTRQQVQLASESPLSLRPTKSRMRGPEGQPSRGSGDGSELYEIRHADAVLVVLLVPLCHLPPHGIQSRMLLGIELACQEDGGRRRHHCHSQRKRVDQVAAVMEIPDARPPRASGVHWLVLGS